jgi:tRNA pseudouridine38-40 synthase
MIKKVDGTKFRYRICVSYDGTDYLGWQKQPQSEMTIQGQIERVLIKLYGQRIPVIGSGRTDRGVHALNQWAHFDLESDQDVSELAYKLQKMTPDTLSIKSLEYAPPEFHAQISAQSKCYKYLISLEKPANPFFQRYSWSIKNPIDFENLQKLAAIFLGEHDFSSFQSQGTPVSTPVRKIFHSQWKISKSGRLEYQVQGSGFLKQMVRNMVGTMIKLEQNQGSTDELKAILEATDRGEAAAPAPPHGLYLCSVQYPKTLDNKCRKL